MQHGAHVYARLSRRQTRDPRALARALALALPALVHIVDRINVLTLVPKSIAFLPSQDASRHYPPAPIPHRTLAPSLAASVSRVPKVSAALAPQPHPCSWHAQI